MPVMFKEILYGTDNLHTCLIIVYQISYNLCVFFSSKLNSWNDSRFVLYQIMSVYQKHMKLVNYCIFDMLADIWMDVLGRILK